MAVALPPAAAVRTITSLWRAGAAALPLDPAAPPEVTRATLERLRPARVIDPSGETELANAHPAGEDAAAVVLTSGSGGDPKAVELSHAALSAAASASLTRIGAGSGDRWLLCVPPVHVAGLSILVRSIVAGTEPVIHDGFDPHLVAAERDANLVSLVPTMLRRLIDAGADLSRWRSILLGGGPIPSALVARATDLGAHIVRTYGMTETCGGVVYDGYPLEGVEMRVEASGRISLKGPVLMTEYRGRPDLTEAALRDGWLVTSDAGSIADGRLTVLGRLDDAIQTGGKTVFPGEVETALLAHPLILDASVRAEPDDHWGERVAATVVASEAVDETELRGFLRARLEAFKVPKSLEFVDGLGRDSMDKRTHDR